MNKYEFRRLARKNNWHPDRINSWVYCHEHHGAPFPRDDWTMDDVEEVSDQALEIYCAEVLQPPAVKQKSTVEQFMDGVTEGMAEVTAHICIHAAKQFFRRR